MPKVAINLLTFLLVGTVCVAANAKECNNQCQYNLVNSYFEKLSAIYRKSSNASDIDALFKSLAPSVRYEHLNYDASFTRDEWKQAFLNNLNGGAYKNEDKHLIRVDNAIHGKGFVAVSYSYGLIEKDGSWSPTGDQNLLALFKITNNKISSVQEYW